MKEQIEVLCDKANAIVIAVEKEVGDYLEKNNIIFCELENIKKLIFYDTKTHRVYEGSEFQEDILCQREAIVETVKASLTKIEEVLTSLHGKIIHVDFPQTKIAFIQYVTKVDKLVLLSLKEVLKRSLLSFEGLLMGSRCCPSSHLVPVFEISVSMSEKKIVCSPPLDIIQETVIHLKEVFEVSFLGLPCLLSRFSNEIDEDHCHQKEIDDDLCTTLQDKLNEEFGLQSDNLKIELEKWGHFRDLWEVNLTTFFQTYASKEPGVESYIKDISSFEAKLQKLNDYPEFVNCGIFRVNLNPVMTFLKEQCHTWIKSFIQQLHQVAQTKQKELLEFILETKSKIKRSIVSLEDVLESKEEMIMSKKKLKVQSLIYSDVSNMFDVLKRYKHNIEKEERDEFERLKIMCLKIEEEIGKHFLLLNEKQEMYRKEYIVKAEEILQIIESTKLSYKFNLPTKSDVSLENANRYLEMVQDSLSEIKEKVPINKKLEVLNLPLIDFSELDELEQDLLYLKKVWQHYAEWISAWNSWSIILVWDISCVALQEMLQVHELQFRQLFKSKQEKIAEDSKLKASKDILNYEIEDNLLRKVEAVKEMIPLIANFQNAQLRKHHWDKIKEIVKVNIDEKSDSFTLGHFQNLNLVLYRQEIDRIFFEAAEETKLVTSLANVESLSGEICIYLKYIPHLGIHVVHSTKTTEEAVKDLIINLTVIDSSSFAKYYSTDIQSNKLTLNKMAEFLQILEDFQKEWLRWNPFFNSPDVRNSLINLSSIYNLLNKNWKDIVSAISINSCLKEIVSKDNLLTTLEEILEDIRIVGRFIQNFLLNRYLHCARFCFLSFDDMIGAVSKVYDGESAIPYLPKLFMNVNKLKQQPNGKTNCMEIIGVFSEEGEFLELNSYIPIVGEFDVWLSKLDKGVENTLREDVKQCRLAVKTAGIKIDEVLKVWPLQVCILSYLLQWNIDIVKAFNKDKSNEALSKKLRKKITDMGARISTVLNENISKLNREKLRLFTLIVFKIRDQLEELSKSPEKVDNFFSYLWEKETNDLSVFITPYKFAYSWEYQGLWKTTIITPTYYQMVYNVATFLVRGFALGILGEERSGKTEFITSLARFLGRNLKSVNVIEKVELLELYLLLLGTYQSHTWLLFKNANKIPIHLLTSLDNILGLAKEKGNFTMGKSLSNISKTFDIDGMTIEHDPRSSVFFEIDLKSPFHFEITEALREVCKSVVFIPPNIQVRIIIVYRHI